ncbi:MAG: hypothetical protein V4675_05730 [Verrucomicrobiota bacterium]
MWAQPLILPMAALVSGAGLIASRVQAGQPQAMPEVLIPIRMPGDPAILLPTQAAGSGLPLTWEVATGPATLSGNVVTLTGELGPVTLKASQSGDAAWDPLVGQVCFSVTEEGGYTQVSMGGEGYPSNWYALSRTARITGWNIYRSSGPLRTPAGTRWRSISAGGGYLPLAVSEDGGLWIWDKSFLGSIPKPNREAGDPVRLGTDNDWSTIAAGRIGRIGIKREGTLWAWEDEVGRPAKQPEKFDSRTDWAEASISGQDYAIVRRSNGECYYPNVYFKDIEPVDSDLWKTASISQSGIVRVRMDGTLWFRYSSQVMQLSSEMDWTAVACLRSSYMALRSDGTLWSAPMTGGLKGVRSPVAYPAPTRWAKIDPGYAVAGLISRDGSLWVRGTTFSRIAPVFFPQTLDFMAAREQPFPVVAGSILAVPEAALNSRLPVELSVVSGPAEIVGQGISFTGPGLVEVSFKQAGNATWGFFEERRTFLSGAPGPEIAVHDGTSANNPARREGGAVILLGKKTRSAMAAGLPRSFVIENTGTDPLQLTAVTAETAGPLTFTTPFVPVTVAPGGSVLLELTLRATEYGSHALTVLLHSDDTDEPAYRIPFQLVLANTPPEARTGPDRQIHAGQPMRLDGAFFSRDLEQAPADLTYEWDLDGNGYAAIGAVQEIILASLGQRLTAKLRVTDADGAVAYSECVISAVAPGMEIPTAIRLAADGAYELVFHGEPGKKYRTFVSWDLTRWEREDSGTSQKFPVMVAGPDGFFPARSWSKYEGRTFYRAQEVDE